MTLVTAFIGVILALLLKRFLLLPDRGKALWSGYLEVPVDVNLAAFMFGIGSMTHVAINDTTPPVILGMVVLLILSIIVWKLSCNTMSDRDSEVYFAHPLGLLFLTAVNIGLAGIAILVPVQWLGAQA
ncbi:hypothetical protein [Agrobacterium cavarae]|uniref:hypothetical protein n=1 Tax=Agrobacterium cavarae TaxID=2528239 RepID=UPI0028A7A6EA|nr:hypothetical protein [Agrobacterium cavarae]